MNLLHLPVRARRMQTGGVMAPLASARYYPPGSNRLPAIRILKHGGKNCALDRPAVLTPVRSRFNFSYSGAPEASPDEAILRKI